MSIPISLTVNGKAVTANVDPPTLPVQLLRDQPKPPGPPVGCRPPPCRAGPAARPSVRPTGADRP